MSNQKERRTDYTKTEELSRYGYLILSEDSLTRFADFPQVKFSDLGRYVVYDPEKVQLHVSKGSSFKEARKEMSSFLGNRMFSEKWHVRQGVVGGACVSVYFHKMEFQKRETGDFASKNEKQTESKLSLI